MQTIRFWKKDKYKEVISGFKVHGRIMLGFALLLSRCMLLAMVCIVSPWKKKINRCFFFAISFFFFLVAGGSWTHLLTCRRLNCKNIFFRYSIEEAEKTCPFGRTCWKWKIFHGLSMFSQVRRNVKNTKLQKSFFLYGRGQIGKSNVNITVHAHSNFDVRDWCHLHKVKELVCVFFSPKFWALHLGMGKLTSLSLAVWKLNVV